MSESLAGPAPRLHAFPGMGADHRMYPAPWSGLPRFHAHDWPPPGGERTLPELAAAMCGACQVQDGDILVGCSLGGMVACEITKLRRIPLLFLVGSALRPAEVSGLLGALLPWGIHAPLEQLRALAAKLPFDLARMFSGVEPAFIRTMTKAMFEWEGGAAPATRIVRIHGRNDLLIPPPSQADLLLDGGHLISMTHPRECAAFIQAALGPGFPPRPEI